MLLVEWLQKEFFRQGDDFMSCELCFGKCYGVTHSGYCENCGNGKEEYSRRLKKNKDNPIKYNKSGGWHRI